MTRVGKIARLPCEIREQLNRRLRDGQQGKRLVDWLNALPEVQAVLKTEFGGRPVSEQNLSEWKPGGYADWLRQQETCDFVRHLVEQTNGLGTAAGGVEVSERLSTLLAVELALTARTLLQEASNPQERWQRLQEIIGRLAQLRREEANTGRLDLERERWEAEQKDAKARNESSKALLPIYAFMISQAVNRLVEKSSPGAQAAAIECLSRFGPEQRPAQPSPADLESAPAPGSEPVQANSRKDSPKDQARSNPIKPNQAP